jgi:hydrogenase expression/formation protein HypD
MSLKHASEYRSPEIAKSYTQKIKQLSRKPVRLMEVCGTHTMAIFRSGIRQMLPETITLLSGPGCPVCVTSQSDIDAFIEISKLKNVITATFGDLMRVPGTVSSLQQQRAQGSDIRIVYSPFDALNMARENPDKVVVFLGVGFETTAPTVAATLLTARQSSLKNFLVYSAHKRVPPALETLLNASDFNVDGFLLPGHVSTIIGLYGYSRLFDIFKIPCVVAGFEAADILYAISLVVEQIEKGSPALKNGYPRAVDDKGNVKAQEVINQVFTSVDVSWRGIGVISESGLKLSEPFAHMDAERVLTFKRAESKEPKGCACGPVLKGVLSPLKCPLFAKTCTPVKPVGPCMVSTEGTCAAFYKYHQHT